MIFISLDKMLNCTLAKISAYSSTNTHHTIESFIQSIKKLHSIRSSSTHYGANWQRFLIIPYKAWNWWKLLSDMSPIVSNLLREKNPICLGADTNFDFTKLISSTNFSIFSTDWRTKCLETSKYWTPHKKSATKIMTSAFPNSFGLKVTWPDIHVYDQIFTNTLLDNHKLGKLSRKYWHLLCTTNLECYFFYWGNFIKCHNEESMKLYIPGYSELHYFWQNTVYTVIFIFDYS